MKKITNSLAIIICMYNEEKVAAKCIDSVIKTLNQIAIPHIVIAVDDGSTDNTSKILRLKKSQHGKKLVIITHKKNAGFGKANSTGIQKALALKYKWCLHMDAGLTNDPKYIKSFVNNISEKYDCIKASRYIKGSAVVGVPKYRRVISIIGNTLASNLFGVGIRDCTNGFRLVRLEKLQGLTFRETNYSMILEELFYLKKRHALFKEIPYTLVMKQATVTHFTYKPKMFYDYFKYALKSFFV